MQDVLRLVGFFVPTERIEGMESVQKSFKTGKIGEVENLASNWYLLDDGQVVSFHTAFTDKERKSFKVIYSDSDTWPSIVAARLGIKYSFMRNSTKEEANTAISELGLIVEKVLSV